MARPATTELFCQGAGHGRHFHCLVHHDGRPDGLCNIAIHPPLVLTNLLGGPLRFELKGSGAVIASMLPAGGSRHAHAFARRSAVAMSAQVERKYANTYFCSVQQRVAIAVKPIEQGDKFQVYSCPPSCKGHAVVQHLFVGRHLQKPTHHVIVKSPSSIEFRVDSFPQEAISSESAQRKQQL